MTLSSEEDIKAIFNSIDTDKNGSISTEEFEKCLYDKKIPVNKSYIQELYARIDGDNNMSINLKEFSEFYRQREKELWAAYEVLSEHVPNGSEKTKRQLKSDTLRKGLNKLAMKASDDEIRRFVVMLDANGDGNIHFDEFRSVLLLLPAINARASFDLFRKDFGGNIEHGQSGKLYKFTY